MPIKKILDNVIIFIVGPTAIGKTSLSIKLARSINGEVISADSMQIYGGMKILSQAPAIAERNKIRHHLIGTLDPRREYSVAIFRNKASTAIDSIIRRKKIPIVVGGSGLYVKALIDGLFPAPEADSMFRKKMEGFVSRYGSRRLHKKLSKIDPEAAEKIHPNDARRIIRALEIYNSTGKTMTELKQKTKGLKEAYKIKIFGLTGPRESIYSRIDSRVDHMFDSGILDEVKKLKRKHLSKTANAVLGFKELSGYLNSEYDLGAAMSLMKTSTRHFAKRQLTWFEADGRIKWFDVNKFSEAKIISKIIQEVS